MADARHIVLVDANGQGIKALDISEVDNADTTAPLQLIVETRCDLGEWHDGQKVELVPWGFSTTAPAKPNS